MKVSALLAAALALAVSNYATAVQLTAPKITGSIGLWETKGSLIWAHDASSTCDCLGSKTSELDWKGVESTGVIAELNAEFSLPVFVNLKFGGGSVEDGKITDDDYFSEDYADSLGIPERFSRTSSKISDGDTSYKEIRIGYIHRFNHLSLKYVSLFIGKSRWEEEYGAYGVDVLENPPINTPYQAIPYSIRSLSHEAKVDAMNLGLGVGLALSKKLSLEAEYTHMNDAAISSIDTHHLRPEDFIAPSELNTNGDGFTAEIKLLYKVYEYLSVAAGYRVMELDTDDGDITMHNPEESRSFPLLHQNMKRSGATLGIEYNFN